jgi:deoxyribonuclease V
MKCRRLHTWDVTPEEAIRLQRELAPRVVRRDVGLRTPRLVAGMDVSYDKGSPWIYAAIVVLRLPDLSEVETAGVRTRAEFPYVPGLLSFREAPAGLQAWARLATRPDCLLCDGHGQAHPRRFGLASHFGLWINRPTIGCAKSVLIGDYRAPGQRRGSLSDLMHDGEVVGAAVRTREATSPVFVSVGHRIGLIAAVATVLSCAPRYRIPEPLRQAHALGNRMRRAHATSH